MAAGGGSIRQVPDSSFTVGSIERRGSQSLDSIWVSLRGIMFHCSTSFIVVASAKLEIHRIGRHVNYMHLGPGTIQVQDPARYQHPGSENLQAR